jgi:hypothetical protein
MGTGVSDRGARRPSGVDRLTTPRSRTDLQPAESILIRPQQRLYSRSAQPALVNARPRPLATFYFGKYDTACRRYLDRTVSGGAVINDVIVHATVEELPFGGIGESGMGAYHGRTGFETFSHARGVVRAPRISPNLVMSPPYSRLKQLFRWILDRENKLAMKRLRH